MVSIELSPFDKPTVAWFIMKYLFTKAQENGKKRIAGEEYASNLHRQWQQFCGKHTGAIDSFHREIRRMKTAGQVEVAREEKGKSAIPRKYYVLSQDYYDAMVEDSKAGRA